MRQGDLVEVAVANRDIEDGVTIHWHELTLPVHTFSGRTAIRLNDGVQRRAVQPGTQVRLRLLNTNSSAMKIRLAGTQASVVAIDGGEIEPAPVPPGGEIEVGAGGRYDVAFRMPPGAASAEVVGSKAALVLSPDGTGEPPSTESGSVFDPGVGKTPVPVEIGSFDRTFRLEIGQKPGSSTDGRAATGLSTESFRATNPGLWMLHCHNLPHARDGLTMHVMYDGVATSFRAGDAAHNHPE